jgi:ribose transport system ATP-binding protein
VHQEIHLLAHRTVARTCSSGASRGASASSTGAHGGRHGRLLGDLGLDLDPRATLGALSTAAQQMVAIARGVSLGARVLVLDEPTSSLAEREVAILFGLVRRLQAAGTAVVYISHRFDEIYALCDRVTVLRDGRLVGTHDLASLSRLDLVCLMLGKSREAVRAGGATGFGQRARTAPPMPEGGEPLLRAEGLRRGHRLRDVSLRVGRGEIVGLAGLLGSGRTETARALFGAEPREAGSVTLRGAALDPARPTTRSPPASASSPRTARPTGSSPSSACARTSRSPPCRRSRASASSTAARSAPWSSAS